MRRLLPFLSLLCASLVVFSQPKAGRAARVRAAEQAQQAWSEETRLAFGFEKEGLWDGGEVVQEPRKSGNSALLWAKHTQNSGFSCRPVPHDWSAFNTMSFWLHSAKANNATFMIVLGSQHDRKVNSYFSQKVTVDWTGWREVTFRFRSFNKAREPVGWQKIDYLRFTASGWNQAPTDESVWVLDDLRISYDPKPYRPAIRVEKYVKEPPREDYLAKLHRAHPRLILLDEELPRLRRFIADDPLGQKWYASIQENAERLLKRPPRIHELPDGRRLLSISRDVLNRMYHWGFMYRIEGDRKWLDRAWEEASAVIAFPDWNPSHYLDTAEMMHATAIAYDWFYHGFTTEQRKQLREGIWKHGLRLSHAAYMGLEGEGQQHWPRVTNNWNFVCNGGSALAAMALLDEMPEECTDVLDASFQYIQIPIHHFEPDGAWWEGIGYWGYSMRYVLSYLRGLETSFGTDFGFIEALKGKGFSMAGDFPIYLNSPSNGIFNFADSGSGGGDYQHWGLFYLAARFRNPLYLEYQRQRASGSVENLIYYEPFDAAMAIQDVALDKYFRKTEVVTGRSSWTDADATFLGIKAGRNGIAHSHQDLGSFIFYGLAERWVQDMGTEGQTYQSHKHHLPHDSFYRIRTEGHNTLVFDPATKDCQERRGSAVITRFETSPLEMFAVTDLTNVYRNYVVSAKRGYRLLDLRRSMLVQDEIQAKKETDLWWFAHGAAGTLMSVSEDGCEAVMGRNGKLCDARLLAPQGASFVAMDARPLPTSPDPDIQQQNRGVKKLAIHLPKARNVTISVLLTPRYEYEPASVPDVHPTPIASWKLAADDLPRLSGLSADGSPIAGFSPNVFTYSIELPKDTATAPQVAATCDGAVAKVQQAASFPGTARVQVTGQAGKQTTYLVRMIPIIPAGGSGKPQAQSKPATVNGVTVLASLDDGNQPKNVLDGNPETRWSASGEKEWISFDFGRPRPLEAIRIAWYNGHQRSTSFQFETSTDGKAWTPVQKGKSSGKTADLEAYPLSRPVSTRYLRIMCYGNSSNLWNSMSEITFVPADNK